MTNLLLFLNKAFILSVLKKTTKPSKLNKGVYHEERFYSY